MEFVRGQLVISRQGRDVTKVYMVAGRQADRLLLTDGDKWPLAQPKPKNTRHVTATGTVLDDTQTETDLKLKRALKDWCESRGLQPKGG